MATELRRSHFFISSDPRQNATIFRCGDQIYSIGQLQYVHISKNHCSLRFASNGSSSHSLIIRGEQIEQFVGEFLRTWGAAHQAPLRIAGNLEAIHYNPRSEPHWILRFKDKKNVEEAALAALTNYLNEKVSLQDQIRRVKTLVGPIMGHNIVIGDELSQIMSLQNTAVAASCLSKISSSSIIKVTSEGLPSDETSPLKDHIYLLKSEGGLSWENRFSHLAELLEKDPNTSELLQECARILRQLTGQFPLRDFKELGNIIRQAPEDDLNILKWHLKLPGFLSADELASEVDGILQEVSDHQLGLLRKP